MKVGFPSVTGSNIYLPEGAWFVSGRAVPFTHEVMDTLLLRARLWHAEGVYRWAQLRVNCQAKPGAPVASRPGPSADFRLVGQLLAIAPL
eukprot:5571367-Amphidinium_carterae.1